jgi:GntR family transcriptional regulator of arabinose operon
MDTQRIQAHVQSATPAPLHQKLREAIREQVLDGTLPPGTTLPSERLMKEQFGISRATVRQAINALIQDGFLQSIPGTGTFVLQQETKPTTTGLIGLITSSPNFTFFYPQLTAAFNERIREASYGLVMTLHSEHAELLDKMVDELLAHNIVGLAITPPRYGDVSGTLARVRRQGIPVVFVGRNFPTDSVDVIAPDNHWIGYQATRHLIELGHERIAYIGLLDYSTGAERSAGYRQAMEEANLPPMMMPINEAEIGTAQPEDQPAGSPREHLAGPAQHKAHEIWSAANTLPHPTAAFCFNDIVAMGVYKGLRELNLAIPNDVSLVSVDNLITVRHFEVPLSTYALPGQQIGIRSAEILLRRLAGDAAPAQRFLLQSDFVPRASAAEL